MHHEYSCTCKVGCHVPLSRPRWDDCSVLLSLSLAKRPRMSATNSVRCYVLIKPFCAPFILWNHSQREKYLTKKLRFVVVCSFFLVSFKPNGEELIHCPGIYLRWYERIAIPWLDIFTGTTPSRIPSILCVTSNNANDQDSVKQPPTLRSEKCNQFAA